jgi:hypothetical protein
MPTKTQIVRQRVLRYLAKKGTPALFEKPEFNVGDIVVQAHVIESWKKFTPGRLADLQRWGLCVVLDMHEAQNCWRVRVESLNPSAPTKPIGAFIPAEGYIKIDEVLGPIRGLIKGRKFGF